MSDNTKNIRTLKEDILDVFHSGATNKKRLGLELEHILVHKNTYTNISYYEKYGLKDILYYLSPNFTKTKEENGNLIGLMCDEYTLTLEPGSQLEISIMPNNNIDIIIDTYNSFLNLITPYLEEHNILMLTLGYSPVSTSISLPLIPVKRYKYMDEYFKVSGTCGTDMMRGSASTQISVDYIDENDFKKKYKVASIISPVIKLLSSNIPVYEGKIIDLQIPRTHIWNNVDNKRCGYYLDSLNNVSFDSYANYILNTEAIYIPDEFGGHSTDNLTFKEIYIESVSRENTLHTLSMVFPDLRLKNYIELRMADSMPIKYVLSYLSLIKGIFYHEENLDYILDKYNVDISNVLEAENNIQAFGYNANIYDNDICDFIFDILNLSKKGLSESEQNHLDAFYSLTSNKTKIFYESFDDIKYTEKYINLLKEENFDIDSQNCAISHLKESPAYVLGKPVEFSFIPKIYSSDTLSLFSNTASSLFSIFNKIINQYKADEKFRKLFTFSKKQQQLIDLDCTSDFLLPILRVDFFYNEISKQISFCEFNTEASSGMAESMHTTIAVKKSDTYKQFIKNNETVFDNSSLISSFANEITDHFDIGSISKNISIIVCFDSEYSIIKELVSFCKEFEKQGFCANVYDVRNLEYKNGNLYGTKPLYGKENGIITIAWKYLITHDIIKYWDVCQDFICAIKDKKIKLIGDFITDIIYNKQIFSILKNDYLNTFLSNKEIDFINTILPSTQLIDNSTDEEYVINNKDYLVIKPSDMYASQNVIIGKDTNIDTWKKHLTNAKKDEGKFILQNFISSIKSPVLPIRNSNTSNEISYSNMHLGMYIIYGKFKGIYMRSGETNIISSSNKCIITPVIFSKGKEND